MEQTRSDVPIRAELRVAFPTQTRAQPRAAAQPANRGEHRHSERTRPSAAPTPVPPRPPRRYSVRAQVLDALRAALLEGTLEPGQVYSAPALAERFGVSATPVREAMQQLACEGVVETVPNRGFRIAEHGTGEAAELAEVRALLEVPVILRLARTLPTDRWRELRPAADATVAAAADGDPVAYAEADRAFHRAVLGLGGNRQLVLTVESLHRRAQCALVRSRWSGNADLAADAAEHLMLLESLERRDLAAVERVARRHLAAP